jgi:ribosome-associated toxin RatA of RatAB toxin-antitoxin module
VRKINFSKSLDVSSINALNVVLDFNEYKNFVPGCSGASLIKRNHPIEIGKLEH